MKQTGTENSKYTPELTEHKYSLWIHDRSDINVSCSCVCLTEDSKDTVELQLALKMCRKDLKKTQEELTGIKADYWDVVPRCNWETLEHNHERSLQQVPHTDLYRIHDYTIYMRR